MENTNTGWMNTLSWSNAQVIKDIKMYRSTGGGLQEIEGELELKQYIINLATFQMICMARIDYEVSIIKGEKTPFIPLGVSDDSFEYRFDEDGWKFIKGQCDFIKYSNSKEKEYEKWIKRYEQVNNVKKRPYTVWVSRYALPKDWVHAETLKILG